jgi:hypothetical protein
MLLLFSIHSYEGTMLLYYCPLQLREDYATTVLYSYEGTMLLYYCPLQLRGDYASTVLYNEGIIHTIGTMLLLLSTMRELCYYCSLQLRGDLATSVLYSYKGTIVLCICEGTMLLLFSTAT